MNILTVDGITKAYGIRKIFDDASFYLMQGEKAGIIGINGTGKSTLLKMIAGLDTPDTGKIILANGITVRYLPQMPLFDDEATVLEAVLEGNLNEDNRWNIESDARSMMTRLGITDFEEKCGHLSGGQKKRLALVALMLSKADLILLDEPTNHLDSEMSEWLENELRNYRGSVIMVTHDRYFLDSVSDRIIEIDKGKIYSYKENYSGYLVLKTEREEMLDATYRKKQAVLRNELAWVRRGARARSTKQKARLERFEELSMMEAPKKDDVVVLDSAASRLGRTTIVLEGISKSFDGKRLFEGFTYNFLKNDRIAIIGKNGCGKSTLLKIMLKQLEPDEGTVEHGSTIRIGYFAQEVLLGRDMDPEQRVIDYIRDVAWYVDTADGKLSATSLLERFLFKGEDQYGPIGKLSGGERRRLYLCRILMSAPNVLVLDEPTNDLDIQTLMVLEDYLDRFDGIVIAVSHDRYFIDRVARRIFAFEDCHLLQSEGGYTDYENRKKQTSETENVTTAPAKNEKKAERYRGNHEKKLKFTYAEQKDYETIEADIAGLEERIAELDAAIEENAVDFVKLGELTKERERAAKELSEKLDRWMYLEELAEKINAGQKKND